MYYLYKIIEHGKPSVYLNFTELHSGKHTNKYIPIKPKCTILKAPRPYYGDILLLVN